MIYDLYRNYICNDCYESKEKHEESVLKKTEKLCKSLILNTQHDKNQTQIKNQINI